MTIEVMHLDARGVTSGTTLQTWVNDACQPNDLAICSIAKSNGLGVTSVDGWFSPHNGLSSSTLHHQLFYKFLEPGDFQRFHTFNAPTSTHANVGLVVLRNIAAADRYSTNTYTAVPTNTFPAIETGYANTYHVNYTAVRTGSSGIPVATPSGWTTLFNQATYSGTVGYQNVLTVTQTTGPAGVYPEVVANVGGSWLHTNYRLSVAESVPFRGWGIPA